MVWDKPMDAFEEQIVVVEDVDCSCGKHHDAGDALWSGVHEPSDEMWDIVDSLHDGAKTHRRNC